MKKIAVFLGISLLLATSNAFAWNEDLLATHRIIGKHIEVKSGTPRFVAYFLSTTKVLAVYNPDRADMQLLLKELDAAYQNGKTLTWLNNGARNTRTAWWYNLNGAQASMTFLDAYSGDSVNFRVK